MQNSNLPFKITLPHFHRLIIISFFLSFIIFTGCRKENIETFVDKEVRNISAKEIQDWFANYKLTIQNGPEPILAKASKTFIKKQMIVRVPLSNGGGEMFFSKNKTLEVIFFRRVSFADKISSRFTGYYESIDMNNYAYKKVNYLEGIKVSAIKGKPIKSSKTNSNDNQNLIVSQSSGTWFSEFLKCLGRFVFAVPKYRNGSWECYGLGGESDDDGGDEDGDDGDDGGDDDFPPYIPIIYPPNLPSPPPGYEPPPIVWNPIELDPVMPSALESALFHKFPLNSNYQTLYPKFYSLVKNLYNTALKDIKTLDGLKSYGHFTSDEKLFEILQFGKGAEIIIKDINTDYNGRFRYATHNPMTNKIYFELSKIQEFELGNTDNARGFSLFLFITLMHESVHYGNAINGFFERNEEWGDAWETYVYGRHIDSPSEAWDYILRKK
jgi:hypothetical protein